MQAFFVGRKMSKEKFRIIFTHRTIKAFGYRTSAAFRYKSFTAAYVKCKQLNKEYADVTHTVQSSYDLQEG